MRIGKKKSKSVNKNEESKEGSYWRESGSGKARKIERSKTSGLHSKVKLAANEIEGKRENRKELNMLKQKRKEGSFKSRREAEGKRNTLSPALKFLRVSSSKSASIFLKST